MRTKRCCFCRDVAGGGLIHGRVACDKCLIGFCESGIIPAVQPKKQRRPTRFAAKPGRQYLMDDEMGYGATKGDKQ